MSKINLGMAYDMKKRNAKKMAKGGKVPKMKLSEHHDENAHKYESDEGTSEQGSLVRSANRSKSWAKDERSSSPSIEKSMAKDSMSKAKDVAESRLEQTKKIKPKIQGLARGGMVSSSIVKPRPIDSLGRTEEDLMALDPMMHDGMSEDMGPSEEEYDAQHFAEGGEIKGVHKRVPAPHLKGGMSRAGLDTRVANETKGHPVAAEARGDAIRKHSEVKKDSIDKWTDRQKNKPKVKGVHEAIAKSDPGTSIAGSYHGAYGSNQETSKRLHKEKLEELKSMPKPKIQGLARGGMVASSIVKPRPIDSLGRTEEDLMALDPMKHEGMSEEMSPAKDEYMAKHFANGGEVDPGSTEWEKSRPDGGWGAIVFKAEGGEVDEPEAEQDQHDSLVDAVMAKRAKAKMMAEGGQVDIESNEEEQPNAYYDRNEAILKEHYGDDLDDMDQPMDSNEDADSREMDSENKQDMIQAIRSKMIKRRVSGMK